LRHNLGVYDHVFWDKEANGDEVNSDLRTSCSFIMATLRCKMLPIQG